MSYVITRRESLYLDLLRALAAFTVLLDHASGLFDFPWSGGLGHYAVIVFFVLSGYVIANVTDTRESNPTAFLVARFARLWSVVFPALLLTILCDGIGHALAADPRAYAGSPFDSPVIRIGAAMAFLTQSWVSIQLFSNIAFWSLPLEFWYYMIFAAWTFIPPGTKRSAVILLAMILAGHMAIVLLPVWLLGVVLQRAKRLHSVTFWPSVVMFVAGVGVFTWLSGSLLYFTLQGATARILGQAAMTNLVQAKMFWFDWIMGLALAVHLAGARAVVRRIPIELIERPVRWCAGISFATYLFHTPLLHLAAAVVPRNQPMIAIALTLAVIALLGPPVERSKGWWRQWLEPIVAWFVGRARDVGFVAAGS